MDAHVDLRGTLRVTDTAAGLLILKEAGGIYAIDGKPEGDIELTREATMKLIAASNPGTLEELMSKTS
jgi:fructose-1,6-bisphosphatase/inositol monophosphatase family enzyme